MWLTSLRRRYLEPPNARHFPTLAAILRLSTKYLIDHLRAQCIAYLSADWPTTLAGWDKREKEAVDKQGRYAPREACAHPILVIGLAREMGITEWLPAAFYDLARYGPRRIVSGAEAPFLELYTDHADGTDPKDKKTVYLGRTDLHTILLRERRHGQRACVPRLRVLRAPERPARRRWDHARARRRRALHAQPGRRDARPHGLYGRCAPVRAPHLLCVPQRAGGVCAEGEGACMELGAGMVRAGRRGESREAGRCCEWREKDGGVTIGFASLSTTLSRSTHLIGLLAVLLWFLMIHLS